MKSWLVRNFGSVNVHETPSGDFNASLPEIYIFKDLEFDLNEDNGVACTPYTLRQPVKVEAKGETESAALQNLFHRALDLSEHSGLCDPQEGVLFRLHLKRGQTLSETDKTIRNEGPFRSIFRSDPEHSHKSRALLDFTPVIVDGINLKCEEMKFKPFHSHILVNEQS